MADIQPRSPGAFAGASIAGAPLSVSVILSALGPQDLVRRSVDSVLAQTQAQTQAQAQGAAPGFELVLVVGSPQAQAQWKGKLGGDPRVNVVVGDSILGRGAAYNWGARQAKGEAYLFLREDAALPPNAVERLRQALASKKGHAIFAPKTVDERGGESAESRLSILTPLVAFVEMLRLATFFPAQLGKFKASLTSEPMPSSLEPVPAVGGACLLVAAKEFLRLKGFDDACQDAVEAMDFCLRVERAEGAVYFVPEVEVTIASQKRSAFDTKVQEPRARSFSHYFHENFGHAYPQPVLWVLDLFVWARLLPYLALRLANQAMGSGKR